MQQFSVVADWLTVLRAAEKLLFSKVGKWDGRAQHYCEFAPTTGRLCRDIVIEPDGSVWTKEDCDV